MKTFLGLPYVAVEHINGIPCLIDPMTASSDGEEFIFIPKVKIVSELQVPDDLKAIEQETLLGVAMAGDETFDPYKD